MRETGYYWCKNTRISNWEILYWSGLMWTDRFNLERRNPDIITDRILNPDEQ